MPIELKNEYERTQLNNLCHPYIKRNKGKPEQLGTQFKSRGEASNGLRNAFVTQTVRAQKKSRPRPAI